MMAVMLVPDMTAAAAQSHRRQFEIGDAGRDVQPGLALHADRLQRIGVRRAADQKIAAAADADRGVGADAAVIAGEFAAPNLEAGAFTAQDSRVCPVTPRSRPRRWMVAR